MSRISVAVIGAGAIGRAHADEIMRSNIATLAAIADPMPQARDLASRYGVPYFPDPETLLASVKPDAAIVATPNAMHLSVASNFIEHGIPVLVEKPVCDTVEDGNRLATLSDKKGVPTLVGHHRRYNPIIRKAREMLQGGALGRLTNASVLYTFFKPPAYFEMEWRRKLGGGPVLINLIHEIDLVRHLCGEIASVQAVSSNAVRGFEVEDTAAILLRLVNGAVVTLSLSDTAAAPWSWDLASGESPNYPPQPVPVNTHFIAGTEGSLTLPTLEHWHYMGAKSWFAPISRDMIAVERGSPYTAQLNHLCRVVRGEEEPMITAADATRSLRATLAIHESARNGVPVSLEKE